MVSVIRRIALTGDRRSGRRARTCRCLTAFCPAVRQGPGIVQIVCLSGGSGKLAQKRPRVICGLTCNRACVEFDEGGFQLLRLDAILVSRGTALIEPVAVGGHACRLFRVRHARLQAFPTRRARAEHRRHEHLRVSCAIRGGYEGHRARRCPQATAGPLARS